MYNPKTSQLISVTVKVSPEDKQVLEKYCQQEVQTQTAVIRMLIQSLKKKMK